LASSILLAPMFERLLYGVAARDPLSHTAAALAIAAVGLAATAVPAIRAARIDPARALKRSV
jgi:putative ABC transport system permease protein